jgi:hypothetical protein
MKERAERILKECNNDKHVVAHIIRTVARDFPPFRTAEKPNEWEKGYHTVLETLHDIANEIESL